jgi:DNA modification methylase
MGSSYEVLYGDSLEVLRQLDDCSVDSMVTDPPAGISFMHRDWDSDKGGRLRWIAWLSSVMGEAYRVLKPGGHALVWAIPRTSHWTATALEDAGWEIRDVITHLFGSGSTGCACMYEGFSFIGIDKEEVYCNIARKRIEYHIERSKLPQQKQRVYVVNRPKNSMLGSLFEEGDV